MRDRDANSYLTRNVLPHDQTGDYGLGYARVGNDRSEGVPMHIGRFGSLMKPEWTQELAFGQLF